MALAANDPNWMFWILIVISNLNEECAKCDDEESKGVYLKKGSLGYSPQKAKLIED